MSELACKEEVQFWHDELKYILKQTYMLYGKTLDDIVVGENTHIRELVRDSLESIIENMIMLRSTLQNL